MTAQARSFRLRYGARGIRGGLGARDPEALTPPWMELGPLRNRTAAGATAAGGRETLRKSVVRYFVNLKFAWWIVPSMNVTVSVRHVLTHNLSVFQT